MENFEGTPRGGFGSSGKTNQGRMLKSWKLWERFLRSDATKDKDYLKTDGECENDDEKLRLLGHKVLLSHWDRRKIIQQD